MTSAPNPDKPVFELADLAELWINPTWRRNLIWSARIGGGLIVLLLAWAIFGPRPPDTRPADFLRMVATLQALSGPPDFYGQESLVPRLLRAGLPILPDNDPATAPVHPWGGVMRLQGQGSSARLVLGGLAPADCITVAGLCKSALTACRSAEVNEAMLVPVGATVAASNDVLAKACTAEANRVDLVIEAP